MKAVIIRPADLGPVEIAQWHGAMDAAALAGPFASPEFAQAVGEVEPRARIAVVSDGPETVAFLPFMAHRWRAASGIGGFVTNEHAFVPCRRDVALDDVVRTAGLDLFQFANLPRDLAPRSGRIRESTVHAIDLSDGYDAYIASRKQPPRGRFIKGLEARSRRLDREHPDLYFDFGGHDESAVSQLIRWKSSQYRRTGKRDPFAPARVRELIERLAAQAAPRCRGSVSVLWAGDAILAVDMSIRSERVFSGWFTAYNPEFAARSPGAVLLLRLIAALAADGVRLFDLSSGDQAFKEHLANTTQPMVTGWVGRARPGALLCRARRGPAEFLDHFIVSHRGLRAVARQTLRGVGTVRTLVALAQGVGEGAK